MIFNGNFEEITVGTDVYKLYYIAGSDGLTAINVRKNSGSDQLYYVYTDYLGSIETITENTGNIVYKQSFDAWGRERNATDWTYTPNLNKPDWLIRGFTGHEHLEEFGLVNMNGRLYDPLLARMLSPDNFVQDNTSTQNYNRYSYVMNNPLKYTDPSGELIGILFAGFYGFYQGYTYGLHNNKGFGKSLLYGLAGSVISSSVAYGGGALATGLVSAGANPIIASVFAGTVAGASGGAATSALYGGDIAEGAIIGGISGGIFGGISTGIGGNIGAFTGGANAFSAYAYGGSPKDILNAALAGGISGSYGHLLGLGESYNNARSLGYRGSFKDFRVMSTTAQRSFAWQREGAFQVGNGRAKTLAYGDEGSVKNVKPDEGSIYGHTHIRGRSHYPSWEDIGFGDNEYIINSKGQIYYVTSVDKASILNTYQSRGDYNLTFYPDIQAKYGYSIPPALQPLPYTINPNSFFYYGW